jgi:ATP-dependent DNA ligase
MKMMKMVDEKIIQLCDKVTKDELPNFNRELWKANMKFDGDRIIGIILPKGEVILMNRRGLDKSANFSEVAEALKNLPANTIVDGEVISYDDNFNMLTRRSHTIDKIKSAQLKKDIPVKYMIFDILKDQGEVIMDLSLSERLKRLNKLFEGLNEGSVKPALELVEYGEIDDMLAKAHAEDREGIILKYMEAPYLSKRTKNWLKLKFFIESQMTMTKYTENNAGIRLEDNQGNAVQCSGAQSKEVKQLLDKDHKVEIFVQYLEMTKDGRMRMPSFRGLVK